MRRVPSLVKLELERFEILFDLANKNDAFGAENSKTILYFLLSSIICSLVSPLAEDRAGPAPAHRRARLARSSSTLSLLSGAARRSRTFTQQARRL